MVAEALERAVLSLDGLALGDAFGESFFAGDAVHRLQARRLSAGPWRWTDDTAMAVSIVETLARRGGLIRTSWSHDSFDGIGLSQIGGTDRPRTAV